MNSFGIVRKLDKQGRVVIPRELLNFLGFKAKDSVQFCVGNNGSIVLIKHKPIGESDFLGKNKEVDASESG